MASSLETNKILAAVLTAGIFASGAGVFSRILYHPTMPEEPSYIIDVAAVSEEGGGEEESGDVAIASLLPSADAASGESGAKKCASCHSFDEGGANKIGPNLWGVVGRDIGSVDGFEYSETLAGLEGEWTFEDLDGFLANPKGYAPGTKMAYAGMKNANDRADLILYMRSLAADPVPLPEAPEQESAENAEEEVEQPAGEAAQEDGAEETAGETETAAAEETTDEAGQAGETGSEPADEATEAPADAEGAGETDESSEEAMAAADDAAEAADETAEETAENAGEQVGEAAEAVTEAAADAAGQAEEQAAAATEEASAAAEDAASEAKEAASDASEAAANASDAAAGAAGGLVAMIADADVADGEKVSKKCKACHVFEEGGKNKLGPALWGVVGRDIASHEGFNYSSALAELEGAWTYEKLDQFLAAPKSYVPGTKMVFAGVKNEADRADLILYLRSLAADPEPLAEGG